MHVTQTMHCMEDAFAAQSAFRGPVSTTTLDLLPPLRSGRRTLPFVLLPVAGSVSRCRANPRKSSCRCCCPVNSTLRTELMLFQMALSSDTPAHCGYTSQWYLRRSHAVADLQLAPADTVCESRPCHLLQAGATLPTIYGETSVWQMPLHATYATT